MLFLESRMLSNSEVFASEQVIFQMKWEADNGFL